MNRAVASGQSSRRARSVVSARPDGRDDVNGVYSYAAVPQSPAHHHRRTVDRGCRQLTWVTSSRTWSEAMGLVEVSVQNRAERQYWLASGPCHAPGSRGYGCRRIQSGPRGRCRSLRMVVPTSAPVSEGPRLPNTSARSAGVGDRGKRRLWAAPLPPT